MLAKFEKVRIVLKLHRIATGENRQERETQQRKPFPGIIESPR